MGAGDGASETPHSGQPLPPHLGLQNMAANLPGACRAGRDSLGWHMVLCLSGRNTDAVTPPEAGAEAPGLQAGLSQTATLGTDTLWEGTANKLWL